MYLADNSRTCIWQIPLTIYLSQKNISEFQDNITMFLNSSVQSAFTMHYANQSS